VLVLLALADTAGWDCSLFAFLLMAYAQTSEFSYQGNLKNGANPATGNHDFEFALYDAVSGGNQVGSTVTVDNVFVTNGIFSVKLDFGDQFPGANRFLEVRVRQSGQPGITTLSPRQSLTSAPYSIKSLTADSALQLGGIAANQYVLTSDPRLSDARNPLSSSPNYIQNGTTQQASSNFNISGNGTVGGTLTAGSFAGGVKLVSGGAKPTCDGAVRGTIWTTLNGTGMVNDTIEVCLWWDGAFIWRNIGGVE
jgi:hypothetical protein